MNKTILLLVIVALLSFSIKAKASERLCNDGTCMLQLAGGETDYIEDEWPAEDQEASDFDIEDGDLPSDGEDSVIEITDSDSGDEMLVLSGKVEDEKAVKTVKKATSDKKNHKKKTAKAKNIPALPSTGSGVEASLLLGVNSAIGAMIISRKKRSKLQSIGIDK